MSIHSDFYQNSIGEIVAFVDIYEDGVSRHKIVKGIESFGVSSEALLDEAIKGFEGFTDFDPHDYEGRCFLEIITEKFDLDFEYKFIAYISDNGRETNFIFEDMNEYARQLFLQIEDITDKIQEEAEEQSCLLFKK